MQQLLVAKLDCGGLSFLLGCSILELPRLLLGYKQQLLGPNYRVFYFMDSLDPRLSLRF